MAEIQIHEIRVSKENLSAYDTGGAIRSVTAEITVDSSCPLRQQRLALIYEILGAYLGSVVLRETLEEIAENIRDKLEEFNG